jgi:hypothetical protein
MTKYQDLDLVALHNRICKRHKGEEGIEPVDKFSNDDDAKACITTLLQQTGEKIIRILLPDYVKRGMAAKRLARYKDGMLVSELIDAFEKDGDTRGAAVRDVRYNDKKGIVKIFA